ncbi:ATP-binding protein [Capnocytophaga sp. ARDL2]|uniref:ATP-binding protein n=1 Tax=Capnocytophaga sp. ARDL2 TaxID=3238809 RepID=UPI003556B434
MPIDFCNYGDFIPGNVEKVVFEDAHEEYYHNRFLATVMFNLKMVDTAGGGIKKIFNYQRARFFPMPDYDLTDNKVKMILHGKILDMDYSKKNAEMPNLSLDEIILMYKVSKSKSITDEEAKL